MVARGGGGVGLTPMGGPIMSIHKITQQRDVGTKEIAAPHPRATIKAHPAAPHRSRPYGSWACFRSLDAYGTTLAVALLSYSTMRPSEIFRTRSAAVTMVVSWVATSKPICDE